MSGYIWARDVDPYASWDPKTRQLKAGGKVYNPGQYLLKDGRAYINTADINMKPAGYVPVRSFFEGLGEKVDWDPATKKITTSGGLSLDSSNYQLVNGTAYADPSVLAAYFASRGARPMTQENLQPYLDQARQIYNPLMELQKNMLEKGLAQARERARQSAISRGTYSSGVTDEAYNKLDAANQEQLANLTKQAEADMLQYAANMFTNQEQQQAQRAQNLAQLLYQMSQDTYKKQRDAIADEQWNRSFAQQDLARQLQQRQALANILGVDPATGKPTFEAAKWQKEQEEAQKRQALARLSGSGGGSSGGSGGVPKTLSERKQLATETLYDAARNRYNQLKAAGYKYPLYYTLNSIMNDPEWVKAATASGADVRWVINALIGSIARQSPQEYFGSGTGAKLKGSYEALLGRYSTKSGDDLLSQIGQY